MTEFNSDQNICKECNNDKRRFARLVKAQEETAWWEALQRENPKAAEKTLKSYSREHKKHGPKHKFSVMQHKRRLKKASGVRGSKQKKLMWEKEYVEEMGKTKHGNMSKREAQAKWDEMKDIPGIKSDNNGPR